jgi:hypothetical protein
MILLTIVTFGIYYLYWLVSTTREMRAKGADIPNAILIIIPVINIWWMWEYSKGVEHVTNEKLSAILTFILMYAVGFIGIYIVQDSFNGVAAAAPAGSPATAATGGQAQAPGGHPVDPAGPSAATAATATGAGVGVAASQVDDAQASPDPSPKPDDKPSADSAVEDQPAKPEETVSPDSDETTQQPDTDDIAPSEDDTIEQPSSGESTQPAEEQTEEDKTAGTDNTPPADPGQMGPSL